ncbi:MAG TPA: GTP-binding protein [Acidimicrobiales bacterium]|nr:GTP-binding protein [Acidimicrobiales bacterium]
MWLKLARAITRVENADPWDLALPQPTRPTHVIGITGPPGAGKSTLTSALITAYADDGKRVGVLAIDPSSPISGGAVLGDRLRMEKSLLGRTNVYVRSLASRGAHGAVAPQTRNVARLLELTDAFDVIIIETVGAGQSEVAIAELADTVCLVTVPGLGDAVQAIKAGFLEVANIVVVNKADRPDAPETIRHLRMNLDHEQEVLATVATTLEGVADLRAAFDTRWDAIKAASEDLAALRAGKFAQEASMLAEAWTKACAANVPIEAAEGHSKAVKRILEEAAAQWTME